MKKIYKISLKLKGSTSVLAEGFGPGEFMSQEVTFDVPENYSKVSLAVAIQNSAQEMIEDNIETIIKPVDQ